jgi:hypothetical protein
MNEDVLAVADGGGLATGQPLFRASLKTEKPNIDRTVDGTP